VNQPANPLLLATRNQGKAREIQQVFRELRFVSLCDFPGVPDVEENGETFAANARLKAVHYHQLTGLSCLADDSGLEVSALAGAPGVKSARYAPTDPLRIARLLDELSAFVEPQSRQGRFVCALCLCFAPDRLIEVEGDVTGRIALAPAGQQGFGYDPIFYYPPLGKTFAEMTPEEKNLVSHRSRALEALRRALAEA